MIKQVVVLAGGLATRLYPITKTIPKSMVPILGEPFFAHQLRLFKKNGIQEVVMCVGHFAEQITSYFGDGSKFGMHIVYSFEKEKLDTGGALKNADQFLDDTFFVTYGDSYLQQDMQAVVKFFETQEKPGLMCVYKNDNQIEPSRVLLKDEHTVLRYQKDPPPEGAQHMEYGLNILRRSIINQVSETVFPLSHYFDLLTSSGDLLAFPVLTRFYEIGSHQGIADLEAFLKNQKAQ